MDDILEPVGLAGQHFLKLLIFPISWFFSISKEEEVEDEPLSSFLFDNRVLTWADFLPFIEFVFETWIKVIFPVFKILGIFEETFLEENIEIFGS